MKKVIFLFTMICFISNSFAQTTSSSTVKLNDHTTGNGVAQSTVNLNDHPNANIDTMMCYHYTGPDVSPYYPVIIGAPRFVSFSIQQKNWSVNFGSKKNVYEVTVSEKMAKTLIADKTIKNIRVQGDDVTLLK